MSVFKKKSREAEQAVLGAAMLTDVLSDTDLTTADFLDDANKDIWSAMQAVHADRHPVDLTTVHAKLLERGRNWTKYLAELSKNTPSAANWKAYADYVKKYSRLARQEEILEQARADLFDGADIADETISALMQLTGDTVSYECDTKSAVSDAIKHLEDVRDGKIKTVPTGLIDLDDALGGFHSSDLIIVGARPALGKTAVMLNFTSAANVPVGIISSEQGRAQIAGRLLSINGGAPVSRMRDAKLTNQDWDNTFKAAALLANRNQMFINDKPKTSILDIERQARKWRHRNGIQALYVDYIQRIHHPDTSMPKHERVGEIARDLKNIARELDIPVIALAQVNRKVEERNCKRPQMGDLADSSEIEKEADQIITLYRDEVYDQNTQDAGLIEYLIRKNRHGEVKAVIAQWRGEYMQVRNLARGAA